MLWFLLLSTCVESKALLFNNWLVIITHWWSQTLQNATGPVHFFSGLVPEVFFLQGYFKKICLSHLLNQPATRWITTLQTLIWSKEVVTKTILTGFNNQLRNTNLVEFFTLSTLGECCTLLRTLLSTIIVNWLHEINFSFFLPTVVYECSVLQAFLFFQSRYKS